MSTPDGRFTIAFNGEIYNHLDLRKQLMHENRAPAWRGHSDTETQLACFAAWGVVNDDGNVTVLAAKWPHQ